MGRPKGSKNKKNGNGKATKFVVEHEEYWFDVKLNKEQIKRTETVVDAEEISTDENGTLFLDGPKGLSWVFASGQWSRVRRA